jgi:hypothetical protein
MSSAEQELLSAFNGHDVESVRDTLEGGANPCEPIPDKLPVYWLLEEYTRSDRLGDCLRLLFARGAVLRDTVVASVLLIDADAIKAAIMATPSLLRYRTLLVSAFTSLVGASLFLVAAEYGNFNAARRTGCQRELEGRN